MKKTAVILFMALASTALCALTAAMPIVEAFGSKAMDAMFGLAARPEKADRRIVLVEVDQASIDHYEKDNIPFPWPRGMYAPIIDFAAKHGAKAVVFDILFNNISPFGEDQEFTFAESIKKSGITYLAASFTGSDETSTTANLEKYGVKLSGMAPEAIVKNGVSLPLQAILDAARGIGSVSYKPDADGVYRRAAPFIQFGGSLIPALFAAPVAPIGAEGMFYGGMLAMGDLAIPVDGEGRMWINYHGPRGTYKRYSAAKVISAWTVESGGGEPIIPGDEFKGAYVIVGYTAAGLFDLKPTPLSSVSPGMEVHAAALDNILNGDFLRTVPYVWTILIAFIGAALVASAVILVPSWFIAALLSLSVAAALFAASYELFTHGQWMNLVTLLNGALFSLVGSAFYKYQVEGKQKRYIQRAFQHYVSPKVVSQIIREPERLQLGGEKRTITVFFSDLVGFTTLSETLPPSGLVHMLNEYTTLMADTITLHDGTVDKYIGDAVMAFWGAPLDQENHAGLACISAIECLKKLDVFRAALTASGGPAVDMRVGLNTGECVVGNMGSKDRFDYTAIGDAVNQASRLEGLNKAYGTRILAAEPAFMAAGCAVFGRKIDFLKVKGKDIPTLVFEIMAKGGEETPEQMKLKELYESAFNAYLKRDWDTAEHIAKNLVNDFGDGPSRTMLERIAAYRVSPPPADWDGSFKHMTK